MVFYPKVRITRYARRNIKVGLLSLATKVGIEKTFCIHWLSSNN